MRSDVFKSGDVVRIRDWDDMVEEFGIEYGEIKCDARFTEEMRYLCGKEFTVGDIVRRSSSQELLGHGFLRDASVHRQWIITSDMVVYADDCNPVDIDVSGLDNLI